MVAGVDDGVAVIPFFIASGQFASSVAEQAPQLRNLIVGAWSTASVTPSFPNRRIKLSPPSGRWHHRPPRAALASRRRSAPELLRLHGPLSKVPCTSLVPMLASFSSPLPLAAVASDQLPCPATPAGASSSSAPPQPQRRLPGPLPLPASHFTGPRRLSGLRSRPADLQPCASPWLPQSVEPLTPSPVFFH